MGCKGCKWGHYDPSSDICDGCTSDPDTGWGGFTDHRVGQYFNNVEEQHEWYRTHDVNDYEEDEYYDDEDCWLY